MKKILILISFLLVASNIKSQVILEPAESDIYEFLGLMADKGIIEFDDNIIPLSRVYLSDKLKEVEAKEKLLNRYEKEELRYWLNEFGYEGSGYRDEYKAFLEKDRYGSKRFYSYSKGEFGLNLSPRFSVKYGYFDGEGFQIFKSGLKFRGQLSKKIGFGFGYADAWNLSRSNYIKRNEFSDKLGVTWHGNDFSEVTTHIGFDLGIAEVSFGKEKQVWGYGESVKPVLSGNAPSFPYLRLDINPAGWLSFNYIIGKLNSDVIDSSSIYGTLHSGESWNREQYLSKYYVSHTLTIKPTEGLRVALGESIIISDRFEPVYTFPFIFFRLADHYTSRNNNDAGGNSQFFLEVSSRNHLSKTHLYGSILIDEVRLTKIFNEDENKNQFAYLLGISRRDFIADNLTMRVEYSRVLPFTYQHYVEALMYTSSSANLGSWTGENSDLLYGSFDYKFSRELDMKGWIKLMRRGSEGYADIQYEIPQKTFLWGDRFDYKEYGLKIEYNPFYDFKVRVMGRYMSKKGKYKMKDYDEDYMESSLEVMYGI